MIGSNFDTPVMYQDLANYTMNPMMGMGGMVGGIGAASYLGGIQMRPQPDSDKVQLMNKKNQEGNSTFKKAMLGIGACLLLGFIPVVKKGIKNSGGVWKYVKSLFTKTPPAPKKPSLLKRFKNKFKKKTFKGSSKPSKWSRCKTWCGNKFNAFKGLFKKKAPVQTP